MIAGSAYGKGAERSVKSLVFVQRKVQASVHNGREKSKRSKAPDAGRLFGAASAVLGIRRSSTFEGEASMALQFAAEKFSREPFGIYEPGKLTAEKGQDNALHSGSYQASFARVCKMARIKTALPMSSTHFLRI